MRSFLPKALMAFAGVLLAAQAAQAQVAYEDDFSDGAANGFVSAAGLWSVLPGGVYRGDADGGNVVSIVKSFAPYSTRMLAKNYSVTSHALNYVGELHIEDWLTGNLNDIPNRDTFLIFDYRGPGNFKYAAVRADGEPWRDGYRCELGHYYSSAFRPVLTVEACEDRTDLYRIISSADSSYASRIIKVVVSGTKATLVVNGQKLGTHDYLNRLDDGTVGVGVFREGGWLPDADYATYGMITRFLVVEY